MEQNIDMKRHKKMPSLCLDRSTGWWYSMIPDASRPRGRVKHTWSPDAKEAERLYQENIARMVGELAVETPQVAKAQEWTLAEMVDAYYRQKELDGKSKSFLGQIGQYLGNKSAHPSQFFIWLRAHGVNPGTDGPDGLTTTLLAEYRDMLGRDNSIGRVQANHYVSHVRMLLLWGIETHGIVHPPLGSIRPFDAKAKVGHGRKQDRTPLTPRQIGSLLKACDPVDKAIVMLGLNCGLGNTDIATLQLADVDLEAGTISNNRRKTDSARDFALWPETATCLKAYLKKHRGKHPRTEDIAKLFFIGHKGMPMVWDVVNDDGRIKRIDAVKNRWDRLCDRAGVDLPYGAGFYILRHTYATMIGQLSHDLREVQAAMGHLTIQQQQTYRHDMGEKARSAQNKLRGYIIKQGPIAPNLPAAYGKSSTVSSSAHSPVKKAGRKSRTGSTST